MIFLGHLRWCDLSIPRRFSLSYVAFSLKGWWVTNLNSQINLQLYPNFCTIWCWTLRFNLYFLNLEIVGRCDASCIKCRCEFILGTGSNPNIFALYGGPVLLHNCWYQHKLLLANFVCTFPLASFPKPKGGGFFFICFHLLKCTGLLKFPLAVNPVNWPWCN